VPSDRTNERFDVWPERVGLRLRLRSGRLHMHRQRLAVPAWALLKEELVCVPSLGYRPEPRCSMLQTQAETWTEIDRGWQALASEASSAPPKAKKAAPRRRRKTPPPRPSA
jgi:hypothetical protein